MHGVGLRGFLSCGGDKNAGSNGVARGVYLHSSGKMPANEWNFSDVNPSVHAWAALFLHRTEHPCVVRWDIPFPWAFNKLLLNFTWW